MTIDEKHMQRALELAREAAAFASPNPTVGCVLAHGDQVLGEGAHFYDRKDHAEIAALKQAGDVRGATAYVTLEPCSHHGRTGPCADALIAAGITRCVIATIDPNPAVRGQGVAKLQAAGIETNVLSDDSPLALEARRLNDAFAFSIQHNRPFVTLKSAVSLDGKIAPATRTVREPVWLTGPAARADVQQLRHAADAILTGIGTVLSDNPSLTDRTGLPRRRPLLRIVLDSELRTDLDAKVADAIAGDLVLFASEKASAETESLFREMGADIVRVPQEAAGALDLLAVLNELHRCNIRSLLLEAGSALNSAFLQAGLVDRVILYFSEIELGLDAVPFARNQPSPYVLVEQLQSVSSIEIPHITNSSLQDIRTTGYLHDPWSNL